MTFFRLRVLPLLFATGFCLADVKLTTQIAPLTSTTDQAGVITMTVDEDDFSDATPVNPVYIRVTLDHDVTLHDTLVPPSQDHDPLFLPAILHSSTTTDQINMPQDAVSIVRWVAGESQIWLRITHASSTWVVTTEGPTSPSPSHPVSFSLGLSARNHADYAGGISQANLTYARYQSQDRPVSTLLCVDLTQSTLQPLPAPTNLSVLNFDPIALQFSEGVETAPTEDDIYVGSVEPVNFNEDTRIGRLQGANDCSLTVTLATITQAVLKKRGQGAELELNHGFRLNCPGGLQPQTVLSLILSGQDHGFPIMVDGDNQPIPTEGGFMLQSDALALESGWSAPIAPEDTVTQVGGVWLADCAQAVYQGPGPGERDQHFTTRSFSPSAATQPPEFQLFLLAPDGAPILDSAPYDAPDQALACGRQSHLVEQSYSVEADRVLITQVTYDDASCEDTATLKNAGPSPINLGGWLLFNGFNHGRIAAGNQLAAGAEVTVHLNTSGADTDTDWYLDQPITLTNSGELALFVDDSLHPTDSMRAYVQWGAANQTHAARAATALLWGAAGDTIQILPEDTAVTLDADAWPPFSRCDWIPSAAASDYADALVQWPDVTVQNLVRYECRADLSPPQFQTPASSGRQGGR